MVRPIVEIAREDPATCQTTYRLSVSHSQYSLHTIYGSPDFPLVLPPAFQVAEPFGANLGGVSPELIAANPSAAFDSWLTIGSTDASQSSALTSNIDFGAWTADAGLSSTNAFVSNYAGPSANTDSVVVVAQLTLASNVAASVSMNFQGHAQDRSTTVSIGDMQADWQATGVEFALVNPDAPASCGDAVLVRSIVEIAEEDRATCQTTYRLSVSHSQYSLHTIYGSPDSPLVLPPAFQVAEPFGADLGGVSPELIATNP